MSAAAMVVVRPFSNGTEESAWVEKWCAHCVHDHEITHGIDRGGDGCELMLNYMVEPSAPVNVEAWVAEPDDGEFYLPSRMVCLRFAPCHRDGCTGDPGADARAERVATVLSYWRERGASVGSGGTPQ